MIFSVVSNERALASVQPFSTVTFKPGSVSLSSALTVFAIFSTISCI